MTLYGIVMSKEIVDNYFSSFYTCKHIQFKKKETLNHLNICGIMSMHF